MQYTQGQRAIIADYLLRELPAVIADGHGRGGVVNCSTIRRKLNHAINLAKKANPGAEGK